MVFLFFPCVSHVSPLRTMVLPAPHLSSCERSRLAAGITPSWRFQRSPWEPWEFWEASVNRGRPVLESTKMLGLVKCLRFITQHVEHVGGIATQNHLGVMFKVRKWDRLGFNQQMVGVALRIGSFTSPTEGGLTTTSEGATNNPQQILHINSNL